MNYDCMHCTCQFTHRVVILQFGVILFVSFNIRILKVCIGKVLCADVNDKCNNVYLPEVTLHVFYSMIYCFYPRYTNCLRKGTLHTDSKAVSTSTSIQCVW